MLSDFVFNKIITEVLKFVVIEWIFSNVHIKVALCALLF